MIYTSIILDTEGTFLGCVQSTELREDIDDLHKQWNEEIKKGLVQPNWSYWSDTRIQAYYEGLINNANKLTIIENFALPDCFIEWLVQYHKFTKIDHDVYTLKREAGN